MESSDTLCLYVRQYGFMLVVVYMCHVFVVLGFCLFTFECMCVKLREYCIYTSKANRFPSKQAKFLRPQRKSTVWVFQSRSETMAPFIKRRWGHGASERERERDSATSHWPVIVPILYSVCHNTGWLKADGVHGGSANDSIIFLIFEGINISAGYL